MHLDASNANVAIVADLLEEGWPSMDLVAEMLVCAQNEHLLPLDRNRQVAATIAFVCHLVRPPMRRRFSQSSQTTGRGYTIDRFINRFYDYPKLLRQVTGPFELIHLADHSYSHLIHGLPRDRTIVTCHDLDTFRCLWDPAGRNRLFLEMTRRILAGFQKAAHVCCNSAATRDELLDRQLCPPDRVSVVHLGLRRALTDPPDPAAKKFVEGLLADGSGAQMIDLLHVGSTIPRKRIDVLLEVCRRLSEIEPQVRLIRVGGAFTAAQAAQAERLGLAHNIRILPFLAEREMAAVYRHCALLLQPSEAEGFGLPVIEALACGTPVLASNLPALREVGGWAAAYAPVGNLSVWVSQASALLAERREDPEAWSMRRERCRRQGMKFSWNEAARQTAEIYNSVLSAAGGLKGLRSTYSFQQTFADYRNEQSAQ
jgi:glycosyltransferase involved in cell wall biosynthesis